MDVTLFVGVVEVLLVSLGVVVGLVGRLGLDRGLFLWGHHLG